MKTYDDGWEDCLNFFENLYLFPEAEEIFECDYGMSEEEKIAVIFDAMEKWRDMCG